MTKPDGVYERRPGSAVHGNVGLEPSVIPLRGAYRPAILLGLLALVAYLPGFWWGAPHATAPERTSPWGVDDEMPLGALGAVQIAITGREDPHPGYPLMHSLMVTAVNAPYLGYLMATGELTTPEPQYPFGLKDPVASLRVLAWLSHLLSVFLAVGAVVLAYETATVLWDRIAGISAGLLVLSMYPMFYYARTGNVDVPALFFMAAALAVYARILRHGMTVRRAVALGIAVGLSVATKEPMAAAFLALPFIVLYRHLSPERRPWMYAYWKAPAAALGAVILAYGLGSGLFLAPGWWLDHYRFVTGRLGAASSGELAFMQTYPTTIAGNIALGMAFVERLADAMTVPGLILAGLALIWLILSDRMAATIVLPALTFVFVLFVSVRVVELRYAIPPAYAMIFPSAGLIAAGLRGRNRLVRSASASALALVVGLGMVRGSVLTFDMLNDTRFEAAEWLGERTEPGDRVAFFGAAQKLPPLEVGVMMERVAPYMGAIQEADRGVAAAASIRAQLREERPPFLLVIPDHSSREGEPHSATLPPEVYRELNTGELGYRLAAAFLAPQRSEWLTPPALDYPTVSPPIRIYIPVATGS